MSRSVTKRRSKSKCLAPSPSADQVKGLSASPNIGPSQSPRSFSQAQAQVKHLAPSPSVVPQAVTLFHQLQALKRPRSFIKQLHSINNAQAGRPAIAENDKRVRISDARPPASELSRPQWPARSCQSMICATCRMSNPRTVKCQT